MPLQDAADGGGWCCPECGTDVMFYPHAEGCTWERQLVTGPISIPESKPSNPKDLIGSNKLPMDLVPGTTIAYLALGHTEGHLKYGLVNWREAGVKMSIYLGALGRHIEKLKGGEWEDPVTQVPHLANALACLSIIVDAYECGKLIDDRPKAAPIAALIDRFSEKIVHLKRLFGESKPVDYFLSGPKERT